MGKLAWRMVEARDNSRTRRGGRGAGELRHGGCKI